MFRPFIPEDDAHRICGLIGSIYFYGNFIAETVNERKLEALLRKHGYFFESEDDLLKKLGIWESGVVR